jgi:hypothetical protein
MGMIQSRTPHSFFSEACGIQSRPLGLNHIADMSQRCQMPPSSSGPGRSPLKAQTGVRVSVGAHKSDKASQNSENVEELWLVCVLQSYPWAKIRTGYSLHKKLQRELCSLGSELSIQASCPCPTNFPVSKGLGNFTQVAWLSFQNACCDCFYLLDSSSLIKQVS